MRPPRSRWIRWRVIVCPMVEPVLPQLWELGDYLDPHDEAVSLAVAERSDVGLADRIRGWRGRQLRVHLADDHVGGIVAAVFRDALVLAESDADRVICLAAVSAVECVDGPVAAAVPATGRERGSGLAVCRDWSGRQVTVSVGAAAAVTRQLSGVGADHLEFAVVGGVRLVPWRAVSWVRAQG